MWTSIQPYLTPLNLTIGSITLVSLLYIASAVGYVLTNRPGMMLAFIGYVIANIGIIWDAIQMSTRLK